jgi:hypothetical protein
MKRIATLILLIAALSFVGTTGAAAQIFHGPDATRQAQKAAKKQQNAYNKANRKRQKVLNQQQKAIRKAAKRAQRGAR